MPACQKSKILAVRSINQSLPIIKMFPYNYVLGAITVLLHNGTGTLFGDSFLRRTYLILFKTIHGYTIFSTEETEIQADTYESNIIKVILQSNIFIPFLYHKSISQ